MRLKYLVPLSVRRAVRATVEIVSLRRFKAAHPRVFKDRRGLRYLIYPDSWIDYLLASRGEYANWLSEYGDRLINRAGAIIDVGANAGLVTISLATRVVPQGKVIAAEPDEATYAHLLTNLRINKLGNVIPQRVALQEDPSVESVTFYRFTSLSTGGLVNDGGSSIQANLASGRTPVTVPASTLDRLVAHLGLTRLDAIKIDVEGAESRILKGGVQTIRNFAPIIEYEYAPSLDDPIGPGNARETFDLLASWGYEQYLTKPGGKLLPWPQPDPGTPYGNLLAIPATRREQLEPAVRRLMHRLA